MGKKRKFYVVWKGKRPGVYDTWNDCKKQVIGYEGAQYKAFLSLEEAQKAFDGTFGDYRGIKNIAPKLTAEQLKKIGKPNFNSIAVDAASSGNPGKMEYRGVDTQTKNQLFHQGPFELGTNNVGEFLALVHGLAFLKKHQSKRVLYSDSKIAINWVKKKQCKTKLKRSAKNETLFELIERALNWLQNNEYTTPIAKWETKAWGEIPADFGRK